MLRSVVLYLIFLTTDDEHWTLLQLGLHVYLIEVLLTFCEVELTTVRLAMIDRLQALINNLRKVLQ